MGGAMAYYRHFVERDDFELFVATTDRRLQEFDPNYQTLYFDHPPLLDRLLKTRLHRWAHSFRHLVSGNFIPKEVLEAAKEFEPDFIFTIAGSWDWTTLMAGELAKRLDVPLVGSFNDWFDFSTVIHPWLRSTLENRFRKFYRKCDLAWCTCEGMKNELGDHTNAQVLYPIGSSRQLPQLSAEDENTSNSRPVVTFAGNLSLWYGQMMEALVTVSLKDNSPIDFRIFGGDQSWSAEFNELVVDRNIFRGHIPFEQLQAELAKSDLLILPMGFDDKCAQVERTSFKTKFLDYLTCKKPIVVWGPDYCSAIQVAKEFDSAEVCITPSAKDCLTTIEGLLESPSRQQELRDNAQKMYASRFHPEQIHEKFVGHTLKLLDDHA